jgi:uncharacterized delta-60 repeat protein
LIVGRKGKACGALVTALLALLWPAAAAPASTQLMAVQPDGKIVLLGRAWPEAAILGRLNADGSLDRGFGDGGFVIDHRLPGLRAVALQPDGRIVGAAIGGSNLSRYLPDGRPDPSFAGGEIGGTDEPDQSHWLFEGADQVGPTAIVVRPHGDIVVGGIRQSGESREDTAGWVRRYGESGAFVEDVGGVPKPGEVAWARLTDLLEQPDGSLIGTGSTYSYEKNQLVEPILARFVPGSGTNFDPSFGGTGLVRPSFPREGHLENSFHAVAAVDGKLLAAGQAMGTFLLARFDSDGSLDPRFGEGGFVAPPIEGPGGPAAAARGDTAGSWVEDVAVMADGRILVGGGTKQWSTGAPDGPGARCEKCPQPLAARFDANGHLDPSFGEGGLLPLPRAAGSWGSVQQVAPLADGKALIAGILDARERYVPFVARLEPDGSYDRSFGRDGIAAPHFPCSFSFGAFRSEAACTARAKVRLRVRGAHSRHPTLSLRVRHSLDWVGLQGVFLTLPEGLRLTRHFKRKLRVSGPRVRVEPARPGHRGPILVLDDLGAADGMRALLERGALIADGHDPGWRLAFVVEVSFEDSRWHLPAGEDRVLRRVG